MTLRDHPTASTPALDSHLESCVDCAAHAVHSAGSPASVETPLDLDALHAELMTTLHAETGPRAWLRSRSTPVRYAIALLVAIAVTVAVGLTIPRPDLGVYPLPRFAAIAVSFAALVGGAVGLGLRPLHRAERDRAITWAALSLVLILGVATLGPAHQAHPASLAGTGAAFWPLAIACFAFGIATALPASLALWLLDRSETSWLGWGLLMAAVAGGSLGNLTLHIHCPIVDPMHRAAAHASVLPALLLIPLVTVVVSRVRRG